MNLCVRNSSQFQPSTERNLHTNKLYHVISIAYIFTCFSHILQQAKCTLSVFSTLSECLTTYLEVAPALSEHSWTSEKPQKQASAKADSPY